MYCVHLLSSSNRYLRNVGSCMPDYTELHQRITKSESMTKKKMENNIAVACVCVRERERERERERVCVCVWADV
jgi:hypothetical protein